MNSTVLEAGPQPGQALSERGRQCLVVLGGGDPVAERLDEAGGVLLVGADVVLLDLRLGLGPSCPVGRRHGITLCGECDRKLDPYAS